MKAGAKKGGKPKEPSLAKLLKGREAEAVDFLLGIIFMPKEVKAGEVYARLSDDAVRGSRQALQIAIGPPGTSRTNDAYVHVTSYVDRTASEFSLDQVFRYGLGLGLDRKTYMWQACMILARAIQLENKHYPPRPFSEEDLRRKIQSARDLEDHVLVRLILRQLWQIHDRGGESMGRSLENRLLEAAMELIPLPLGFPLDMFSLEELLEEAQVRKQWLLERALESKDRP